MWRTRQDGQSSAELLGIVVVVALVIAMIAVVVVRPGSGSVAQDTVAAVCRVALVPGCTEGTSGNTAAGPGAQPAGDTAPGPGAQPADDTGCSGLLGCAWSGVKQVGSGAYNVGKAAVDDVTGLVDVVTHPGKLIDAGKYIVTHPVDAARQLVWDDESQQMWNDGDYGGSVGRTLWNVGSWFIPFYDIGKAGSKVGKLGEVGRVADAAADLAKVSRLADDAGALARRAEAAAARGDLAAAREAAEQAGRKADEAQAEARRVHCPTAIGGGGGVGLLGAAFRAGGDPCSEAGRARTEAEAARTAADDTARAAEPIGQQLDAATVWTRGKLPLRDGPPGEILVKRAPDGSVSNYAVYGPDGLIVKRVDVTGRSHAGVPTPHTVDYVYDTNPDGVVFPRDLPVRAATPDEVP